MTLLYENSKKLIVQKVRLSYLNCLPCSFALVSPISCNPPSKCSFSAASFTFAGKRSVCVLVRIKWSCSCFCKVVVFSSEPDEVRCRLSCQWNACVCHLLKQHLFYQFKYHLVLILRPYSPKVIAVTEVSEFAHKTSSHVPGSAGHGSVETLVDVLKKLLALVSTYRPVQVEASPLQTHK